MVGALGSSSWASNEEASRGLRDRLASPSPQHSRPAQLRAGYLPSQVGRAFAYVLMVGGLGLFVALTANFASILVRKEDFGSAAVAALVEEVWAMREELAELREQHPSE